MQTSEQNSPVSGGYPCAGAAGGADFSTAEILSGDSRLHTIPVTGGARPAVPEELRAQWVKEVALLIDTLGVSAGLIMRIDENAVEVFVRCGDPGENYAPEARFPFGTGSYCEKALGKNSFLILEISQPDEPASGAQMPLRHYCGLPLHWPDGSFFGTLCLLQRGALPAEEKLRGLVSAFGAGMEKDLELLCLHRNRDDTFEQYARTMEALLQYSPGGIFSYSAEEDEQFSFLSDNMLSFLGYTREAFTRKFENRFSRMVYEEDRARVLREIGEQIAAGPFDQCEYRIEKGDGSLVWVHDEGHIVADAGGKQWFYVVIVDITESVRAQQRERDKFRSTLQSLLAANPEAMGTMPLNLTQNLCGEGHGMSPVTQAIIRARTVDAFFSDVASHIVEPEQRWQFLSVFARPALLDRFAAGKTSFRMDYRRQNGGGIPIWVRMYLNLLKNPDTGDVEGVAYSLDISRERRRDEILHIITSQEYDLIALLHLDVETVEAYFLGETLPKPFRELLPEPGATYSLSAFRANAMEKWLHPEDRERYRQCSDPAYYRPLMDANGHFEFVLRECFGGPGEKPMYRKFQHYYLGSDRDTILVIESDVTQMCLRQQQELARAKAETERVRDIMNSITSGISVLHMPDPDHLSIAYVNQQMYRLLGFVPERNDVGQMDTASEQLVMDYAADAFTGVHPADLARVKRVFRENFQSEYFVVENYRTRGSGGKYFWIKEEVRLREVTPEYRVFYATYHDVSEEVRLNGELTAQLETEKRLRQEAITANAAKTDFLSRMSHDIRTPLNGIIGMTYLARQEENPPRTADCLGKIDTSSKFLLGLINDVLDMSRAESDRIDLRPEPYPLAEFNDYLDAVIRPLCQEKGQKFVLDESGALREYIPLADKLRINQVLFNLLSNAVKYTPEGGTITYRMTGRLLEPGRIAVVHEISDTGIGMSEAFQKILFEPFTQEGRDDTSESRGTGLGLAIVKKLVDRMGGTIAVHSRIGQGSTFAVQLTLPAVPAALPADAPPRSAAPAGCGTIAGMHVLLCEDHPLNQEIVKALLEQRGAFVEIAGNGRQGVDQFAKSPPFFYGAILMDIRMPVMDGFEAARRIRALRRADAGSVPILAMTADAFAGDVRRCMDAGMNAHMAKPVDPERLSQTLAAFYARGKEIKSNG